MPRKASQITVLDYDRYDYIIGMGSENMRDLNRITKGDPQGKTIAFWNLSESAVMLPPLGTPMILTLLIAMSP